jgi:hypothetical protein
MGISVSGFVPDKHFQSILENQNTASHEAV